MMTRCCAGTRARGLSRETISVHGDLKSGSNFHSSKIVAASLSRWNAISERVVNVGAAGALILPSSSDRPIHLHNRAAAGRTGAGGAAKAVIARHDFAI